MGKPKRGEAHIRGTRFEVPVLALIQRQWGPFQDPLETIRNTEMC